MGAGPSVGQISVKVTPDLDEFREKIRIALEEIEKEHHELKVNVDLDMGKAEAKLEELRAMADKDMHVKVHLDVDRNALSNMLKKDVEKLALGGGVASGGGSAVGGAGSAAGGAIGGGGTMLRWGAIAGLVASLAAPALALASGALVTLPALIAGVVAPVGVLALGIGGLKKAAEETGWLDAPVKGKKGGKGKESPGEQVKELVKVASDSLHDSFIPALQNLGEVLSPLKAAIPTVSKGLGDMASSFVNSLISVNGKNDIEGIVHNIGRGLSQLAPGLEQFSSGLLNLTEHVTEHAGGLTGWLDKVGQSFDGWVTRITTIGEDGLSPLDKGLKEFGDALKPIADTVGDMAKKGFDWLSSPDFGNSMKSFASDAKGFVDNVLPELGTFFQDVSGFIHDVSSISDKLENFAGGENGWLAHLTGYTPDHSKDPKPSVNAPDAQPGQPNWSAAHQDIVPPPVPHDSTIAIDHPDKADSGSVMDSLMAGFGFLSRIPENLDKMGTEVKNAVKGFLTGPGSLTGELGALGRLLTGAGGATAGAAPTPFNPGTAVGQAPPPPPGGAPHAISPAQIPGVQSVAPPPIPAPKIEAPKVPPGSDKIWAPLIAATQAAGNQINATVRSWAGTITSALASAAGAAQTGGAAIGQRLAAGISAGEGAAVAAMQHLAAAVQAQIPHSPAEDGPFSGDGWNKVKSGGTAIADQFGKGIDEGQGGVVSRAQALAAGVHDAIANGAPLSAGIQKQIKDMQAEIQVAEDQLRVQEDALPGKDNKGARQGLKDQIAELKSAHDQLKLGTDQGKLGKDGKGGDSMTEAASMITKSLASMLDAGKNFAMANVNQFEQDVGISGNGAVETIANTGISWMEQMLGKGINGAFGVGGKKGDTNNFYGHDAHDVLQQKANHEHKQLLKSGPR